MTDQTEQIESARSKRVRDLNNQFRKEKLSQGSSQIPGCLFLTPAFWSLPHQSQQAVLKQILLSDDIPAGNNPYGENDFGHVSIKSPGDSPRKFLWKIDYFSDETCGYGAGDASDEASSYRVLTIMEASEY